MHGLTGQATPCSSCCGDVFGDTGHATPCSSCCGDVFGDGGDDNGNRGDAISDVGNDTGDVVGERGNVDVIDENSPQGKLPLWEILPLGRIFRLPTSIDVVIKTRAITNFNRCSN